MLAGKMFSREHKTTINISCSTHRDTLLVNRITFIVVLYLKVNLLRKLFRRKVHHHPERITLVLCRNVKIRHLRDVFFVLDCMCIYTEQFV